MRNLFTKVDKEFILKSVSEEEIFEKYMQTRVYPGTMYRTGLREDRTPSATFKITKNRLMLVDYNGSFYGDCFEYVQAKFGISFWDALDQIAQDFKLITRKTVRKPRPMNTEFREEPSKLRVQWREFEKEDLTYWETNGIWKPTLDYFNVGAIQYLWIDNVLKYSHRKQDRAYGYWFNEEEIKAYFVNRVEYRFIGNFKGLQGYSQLPKSGELLIITKSLKDVMYYRQMGIYAVAPSSESSILTPIEYDDLSSRFTKIVVNYDFDRTGVRSTHKMKKLYNLPYFFIRSNRHDVGPKDVTDHHKAYGYQRTKELVHKRLRDAGKI